MHETVLRALRERPAERFASRGCAHQDRMRAYGRSTCGIVFRVDSSVSLGTPQTTRMRTCHIPKPADVRIQEMIAEVLTKRVPQERSDEDCLSD